MGFVCVELALDQLSLFLTEFETTASKRISEVMEIADQAMKMNKHAIDICREHIAKLKEAMDANTEEVRNKGSITAYCHS